MSNITTIWLPTFAKSRSPVTITGDAYVELVKSQEFKTYLGISIKTIANQIRDDSMNVLSFNGMHISHGGCSIQIGVAKGFCRLRETPLDILNRILTNPSQARGLVPPDSVDSTHHISVQISEKGVSAITCGIRFHEGADFIAMIQEATNNHLTLGGNNS